MAVESDQIINFASFTIILAPICHVLIIFQLNTKVKYIWCDCPPQAELLCGSLYGPNSDFVDWHQFIVCAAQLWPRPSAQDLIYAMQQFSPPQSDTTETSLKKDNLSSTLSKPLWVNREQYMATDLWLTRGGPQLTGNEQEGEGEKFDRNQKLKEV